MRRWSVGGLVALAAAMARIRRDDPRPIWVSERAEGGLTLLYPLL